MARTLRLRAEDAEDLKVLSAYLQDAIVPICDLGYFRDERRFVLVANRFKWETCHAAPQPPEPGRAFPYERTHCGLRFEGVRAVRTRGIDLKDRSRMLNLLAIGCGTDEADAGHVFLHFAGGACIRVEMDGVRVQLEDIGDPWPTSRMPSHPLDGVQADAAQ
jgi:hypothetical protein